MRLLAEFIMRGRLQAAIVALIGNWVPMLAPGAVALVSLRVGAANGFLVFLWALLPAALMLGFSQMDPVLPQMVISGLAVTYLVSLLLRSRASWAHCLLASVALATLSVLLQRLLAPDAIQALTENWAAFVESVREQGDTEIDYPLPDLTYVSGVLAAIIGFTGVLGVILGRWWQALLYNPGGFAQEFQQLRLNPVQAMVCFGAGAYCLFQGPQYSWWALVFTLPLFFVGIAIVHRLVALKGLGVQWLILFYIALVLFGPLGQLLLALAFIDTWLNIRGRVKPKSEV